MKPLDERAKVPRTWKLGVKDIAEAAMVAPSVVYYHGVDVSDLVEVAEFIVASRVLARLKGKRSKAGSGEGSNP